MQEKAAARVKVMGMKLSIVVLSSGADPAVQCLRLK